MNDMTLKKLFDYPELESIVNRLSSEETDSIAVFDNDGGLIFGKDNNASFKYPINVADKDAYKTLGYVKGGENAKILADVLAVLLKKSHVPEVEDRDMNLLCSLSEDLSHAINAEDIGQVILDKASILFENDKISLLFLDDKTKAPRVMTTDPGNEDKAVSQSETTDKSILMEKLLHGISHDKEVTDDNSGTHLADSLFAAFHGRNQVLGGIQIEPKNSRSYGDKERKILGALASQAAIHVESSRNLSKLNHILKTIEELNQFNDVHSILDKILFEARELANADAGSIFLVDGNSLQFSYVHNDTMFKSNSGNKALYSNFSVPISEKSIVGYAALTGQTIVIDDAYTLSPDLPYSFNSSYDKQTGYRTTSILTIPLKSYQDNLVGVMQIINAKNNDGESIPFPLDSQTYIPLLANNASVAIQRAMMTREMILRMMKLAELRDPKETGAHVQRVGAYSSEIYQRWATKKGINTQKIKTVKDLIRVAAMLHDVGKVGIPDAIIKKPGKLTDEEFVVMKRHTVMGARLFHNPSTDLDKMCYDIALNHHEKWVGGGYPGKLDNIMIEHCSLGEPKKFEEIPIAARITALADVFDALSTKRSYKDPMPEDKVISIINKDSGTHFDPEVVEAFFEIFDVLKAIQDRYKEDELTVNEEQTC